MKFVTFTDPAFTGERTGLVEGNAVHALPPGVTLLSLLGDDGERLHDAGDAARRNPDEVFVLNKTTLLAPLPTPPTIRDFLAFERHLEGALRIMDPDATVPPAFYTQPAFYFTNPYAVVGPYDDVLLPPGSTLFDYELELAAVIGRAGYNLTPEQAEAHIVGYTVMNDWSARDLQIGETAFGLGPAKAKDTATTLGPCLVTADELEVHRQGGALALTMTVRLNGAVMGSDTSNSMYWTFGELISYATRGTWIRPGDLIGSGTCGMGCLAEGWGRHGFDFGGPLAPGDVVEMTIDGIGTISNTVRAAAPLHPLRPSNSSTRG